ncbi:hypothetical protein AWN76_013855 [Rhodothermaceae bacterium RA]|nr:hypothetical protein AWN76_013855 [Rhodothermaceae bacterium RA]
MRLRAPACAALGLLLCVPALAQPVSVPVDTGQSTLAYTGHHRLHDWTGVSRAVTGALVLDLDDPARSRVEIEVPVESFDSGNGNRDSNMLDVVEADRYPTVRFVSERITAESWETTDQGRQGTWQVEGLLTFHGQTHPLTIPVEVTVSGATFEARSVFEVSLDAYDVDRPKLLLMPIRPTIDLEATIRASLPVAGTD